MKRSACFGCIPSLIFLGLEPGEPVCRCPPGSVVGCCVFLFVQKFGQLADSPALAGSPLQAGCFYSPTCWNFLLTGSWSPSSLAGVHLLRLPLRLATWTQDPGSTGNDSKQAGGIFEPLLSSYQLCQLILKPSRTNILRRNDGGRNPFPW